jgi:peptidoglycan/xylan/chitin deacetylase (PgdA/CDA1 family)
MNSMQKINRRKLLKKIGISMMGAGIYAGLIPYMQQLSPRYMDQNSAEVDRSLIKPVDPTVMPEVDKPNLTQDEINFIANHEIIIGDTQRKVIAMTYDDVTDDRQIDDLLDVYQEHGVKATFFAMGADLIHCKVNVPRLVEEGHELAFHGWVHDYPFTQLSDEALHTQFRMFTHQVRNLLPGYRVHHFRAPFGDRNQRVREIAAQWGMQHVLWSLESGGNDKSTINNVVDRVKSGDIVLSHVNRVYDISEADTIVRALVRKGFSLETLSSAIPAPMKFSPI